jgi:streptogramin lyase
MKRHMKRRVLLVEAVTGVALTLAATTAAAPRPIATFHTPYTPTQIVSAFGAIWVAGGRGGDLYRLNPTTNRIGFHLQTNADTCDLWTQAAELWLGDCDDSHFRVTDVRRPQRLRNAQRDWRPYARSLWGWSGGSYVRIDPKTHVVVKSFPHIQSDVPNAFGYGSVWFGTYTHVTRIDVATNAVSVIPLPGAKTEPGPAQGFANPWHMALAAGRVWFGNPAGIYRLDTRTNTATLLRIPIGPYPDGGNIDIVAGAGSIWAGTSERAVVRIDPSTGNVIGRYPGGGGDIAVAFGSLWVTKPVIDQVWRIPVP